MKSALILVFTVLTLSVPVSAQSETRDPVQTDIFVSDRGGYHTYRIPSLITTKEGTLLAFCEGRKSSGDDNGDVDLLLKRSLDGGKTWSAQQVIWDEGKNTCGNPCPVIDEQTGTIWLLMTHNLGTDTEDAIRAKTARSTRTVWVCRSTDDGQTWSSATEITSTVKDPSWGWYATGPGVGIQIKHGQFAGRLVIPCDHTTEAKTDSLASHVIYSDDHGSTWKLGGVARPNMNECQVVEVADGKGTLLLDMRSYLGEHRRAHSLSRDGGSTWTEPRSHPDLVEPVCQASILRYSWPGPMEKSRILFSNPASEKRRNLTIRLSFDEGKTWPTARTLHEGPAAYSCLAVMPDRTIACLYEHGDKGAYEKITFASFTLDWLTGGGDSAAATRSKASSR